MPPFFGITPENAGVPAPRLALGPLVKKALFARAKPAPRPAGELLPAPAEAFSDRTDGACVGAGRQDRGYE